MLSCALDLNVRRCVATLQCSAADRSALVSALCQRVPPTRASPALLEAFASLAWLCEYLRVARIPVLVLAGPPASAVLDLAPLLAAPKRCHRPACSAAPDAVPFVHCAECRIATWCSGTQRVGRAEGPLTSLQSAA